MAQIRRRRQRTSGSKPVTQRWPETWAELNSLSPLNKPLASEKPDISTETRAEPARPLENAQTAPAFADPAILEAQRVQKARDAILNSPYLTLDGNVLTVAKPALTSAGSNQNEPTFNPVIMLADQNQLGQIAATARTLLSTPHTSTQVPQTTRIGGAADTAIPEAQKVYDKKLNGMIDPALVEAQKAYDKMHTGMIDPALLEAQKAHDMMRRPPQIAGHENIGYLSGVGESGNDPGIISSGKGDSGGKSYGAFQFSSRWEVQEEFLDWLETEDNSIYRQLESAFEADGNTSGSNFDDTWRQIAKDNKDKFFKLQYEFTKYKYYDSFVEAVKNDDDIGFDFNSRGFALKNVFWSRAVQHGNSVISLVENAFMKLDLDTATDEEIIQAIYAENGAVVDTPPSSNSQPMTGSIAEKLGISGKYMKYFSGNSSEVQISVWKRLNITELEEALELLDKYG